MSMIINAYVSSTEKESTNNGVWLRFPLFDVELITELKKAELYGREYVITHYETVISEIIPFLKPTEELSSLNELAKIINGFTLSDAEVLTAILGVKTIDSIAELIVYSKDIQRYVLLPAIENFVDLAKHFIHIGRYGQLKESAEKYIQYVKLGEKIKFEDGGIFTPYGYLYRKTN